MRVEDLRLDPNRPYAFKSPVKRALAGLLDKLGSGFFKAPEPPVDWERIRKVAILRLDHLGDVLLALPAVQALEKALPRAQVDFIVGPWAKDIVGIAGLQSSSRIFSASWFSRSVKGQGVQNLEEMLRQGGYKVGIDLRGDFRHIWAMYRAGIPHRIGPIRTGLGFLLTHPIISPGGIHEIEMNFNCLEQAGLQLPDKPPFPRLFIRPEDKEAQQKVRRQLGITRPVVALHATCLASAKRWPTDNWRQLIEELPGNMDVVLIGTGMEKSGMEEIQKGSKRMVFLAAGLLSLPALAAFLKDCKLFIGVDSGPAHIAAAVGTPTLSLYSGTNVASQWAPRGPRVTVLQGKTPCSPCELADCPIGNECMRLIGVDEVLKAVQSMLGGEN